MATVPSASPRGSGNSSPKYQADAAAAANNNNNGGGSKPQDQNPNLNDGLDHLDSPQYIERFKKYEADYTQYLLGKYFSRGGPNGGNIYEEIKVGDEVIRASRDPCFKSYLDPVVGFEEQCSSASTPPAESQAKIPNGKPIGKKN